MMPDLPIWGWFLTGVFAVGWLTYAYFDGLRLQRQDDRNRHERGLE